MSKNNPYEYDQLPRTQEEKAVTKRILLNFWDSLVEHHMGCSTSPRDAMRRLEGMLNLADEVGFIPPHERQPQ